MDIKTKFMLGPAVSLGFICLYLLGLTLRFIKLDLKILEDKQNLPAIFLLWHSDLLLPTIYFRNTGYHALISQHRDGEFISRIAVKFGYQPIRGSSTRGRVKAIKQIVENLKFCKSVVVTPDGPLGPAHQIKLGIIKAAMISGYPIVPVVSDSKWVYRFGSWDRFKLPLPFSKASILMGKPISISPDLDEKQIYRKAKLIEKTMLRLEKVVAKKLC
ncbi:MAG: lysophospholipid acyltransferase family protein [bacterium]